MSAAALIAASSVHIQWSQNVRMYTLGTALVFMSSWLLVRALRSNAHSSLWWTGYAFCATAFAYTHNYALFSIAAQASFCLGMTLLAARAASRETAQQVKVRYQHDLAALGSDSSRLSVVAMPMENSIASAEVDGDRTSQPSSASVALMAFTAVVVLYLPWVKVLAEQTKSAAHEYWTPQFNASTVPECLSGLLLPTNDDKQNHLSSRVATTVCIVICALLILKRCAVAWLLLGMVTIPVVCGIGVSVVLVPILVPHYLLFAYMFVLCGVAYLATDIASGVGRNVLMLTLLVNSVCGHIIYWISLDTDAHPGIAAAVAHIVRHRRSDEYVVVTHPTIYFSVRYYLREVTAPALFVLHGTAPHYLGGSAIPADCHADEQDLTERQANRIWVVDVNYAPDGSVVSPMPLNWKAVGNTACAFPEVHGFLGIVSAAAYERQEMDRKSVQPGPTN